MRKYRAGSSQRLAHLLQSVDVVCLYVGLRFSDQCGVVRMLGHVG